MLFRFVRHVIFRVFCRLIVFISIDAENGEIAGMPRPHPVVGIAAKLSDCRGRGAHQPHILVDLHHIDKILIALEKRPYHCIVMSILSDLFDDLFTVLPYYFAAFFLRHVIRNPFEGLSGHIIHIDQERDCKSGVWKFLFFRHSPEPIGEVIILERAVRLDLSVSAVMVGQHQPFGRYNAAGTSPAEQDDGIFQAVAVYAIKVFGTEPQALFLHIFNIVFLE